MSCCGRQRQPANDNTPRALAEGDPVWVSYAGVGTIVVKGPATGHTYRFAPGKLLRVHAEDALSMRGVPGLRRNDTPR